MSLKRVEKYDYRQTRRLVELREAAGVTQVTAAAFFGLPSEKGRDTIAAWENGTSAPRLVRRERFVSYLRELLRVAPADLAEVWAQVMVGQWRWSALDATHQPLFEVPLPTVPFVGRAAERAEIVGFLSQAIADNQLALCAIHGMAGVGKTELAQAIAHQTRDLFTGGQLFVSLRGDGHAHQAYEHGAMPMQELKRIIAILEPTASPASTEADLATQYRRMLAGRRMLIVADNARDAQQVAPFIPPAGCALLVTSRSYIDLPGMRRVLLSVLDPGRDLEAATRLLLAICPRIGGHAPELARLCGYLPLALRLCASLLAAMRMRKVDGFIEALRVERLSHMIGSDPGSPAYSVAASIQLSYQALSAPLQRVMVQLSVFPASFDLAAAEAVVQAEGQVAGALEQLYLRSMVEYQEHSDRYVLHDLVREYCQRQLAANDAVHLRHAQHYVRVAQLAGERYKGGDALGGLALFDQERAQIDRSWAWAREHAGNPVADELLVDHCLALTRISPLRYDVRIELIARGEMMRDASLRLGDNMRLMRSYNYLAVALSRLGEYRKMIDVLDAGRALAVELGDTWREGILLNNLGYAYLKLGDHQTAIRYLQERIVLVRQFPDRREGLLSEAYTLTNLTDAYLQQGDARLALECAQRSCELLSGPDGQPALAAALVALGSAQVVIGERAQAEHSFERALQLAKQLGDREDLADASWNLGKLLAERDKQRAQGLMQLCIAYLASKAHPDLAQYQVEYDALWRGV